MTSDRLRTVQAASGLVFASFLGLHLTAHALANIRFSLSDVIEGVIITSAGVHITASLARGIARRRREKEARAKKLEETTKETSTSDARKDLKFHRWSGYLLTFLIGGHIYSLRVAPLIDSVDLSLVSWSIKHRVGTAGLLWLLGSAGWYHFCYGVHKALQAVGIKTPPIKSKPWKMIRLAGVVMMGLAVFRMGRQPVTSEKAELWAEMHGSAKRLLGNEVL
ncbi:hypothetical protein HDU76_011470 [Blyttiomyces sp. JEL0837]|nr:hypothetical protein HDU76_011470 [Blyttiomyces sp. JEL0837]